MKRLPHVPILSLQVHILGQNLLKSCPKFPVLFSKKRSLSLLHLSLDPKDLALFDLGFEVLNSTLGFIPLSGGQFQSFPDGFQLLLKPLDSFQGIGILFFKIDGFRLDFFKTSGLLWSNPRAGCVVLYCLGPIDESSSG